ncbi:MAG: DUF1320 domain-containing protein [Rhizobiaceae bacterium]
MSYCTQADLEARYGATLLTQLSDRADAPGAGIDADLFSRAIADADALIDGFMAGRYAVPLAVTPPLVKDLAQRIAIYYAHGETVGDKIRADHDAALRQLRDIANGLITLNADGAEPAASGGAEILTNQDERPFTPGTMKGFI